MKPIEQLEQEAKQAREEAEKACKGVDPKIVELIGSVIHAAFLQYTIGMMQQREANAKLAELEGK